MATDTVTSPNCPGCTEVKLLGFKVRKRASSGAGSIVISLRAWLPKLVKEIRVEKFAPGVAAIVTLVGVHKMLGGADCACRRATNPAKIMATARTKTDTSLRIFTVYPLFWSLVNRCVKRFRRLSLSTRSSCAQQFHP